MLWYYRQYKQSIQYDWCWEKERLHRSLRLKTYLQSMYWWKHLVRNTNKMLALVSGTLFLVVKESCHIDWRMEEEYWPAKLQRCSLRQLWISNDYCCGFGQAYRLNAFWDVLNIYNAVMIRLELWQLPLLM